MRVIETYKDIKIWDGTDEAEHKFFCNYGLGWQGFPRYIGNDDLNELKKELDWLLD